METIVMLTNELPLVMATASLIAALLAASVVRAVIRFKGKPLFKPFFVTDLAVTLGAFRQDGGSVGL
jgi:hypothetical protein